MGKKTKFKYFIALSLVVLSIVASGCTAKEINYVSQKNPNEYIKLNTQDHTYIAQLDDQVGGGNYKESDTDYILFGYGGFGFPFKKLDDNTIIDLKTNVTYARQS